MPELQRSLHCGVVRGEAPCCSGGEMQSVAWLMVAAVLWWADHVTSEHHVELHQGHGPCTLVQLHVSGANHEQGSWSVSLGQMQGTITHNAEESDSKRSQSGHWDAAVYYSLQGCGATDESGNSHVNRTYAFHANSSTFEDSVKTCKSNGASLAFPTSEDEAKALQEIFSQHRNISDVEVIENQARVGAYSPNEDGRFFTRNGEVLKITQFTRWAEGQPDNYLQEESCVAMMREGLLNDVPCWLELPFICVK